MHEGSILQQINYTQEFLNAHLEQSMHLKQNVITIYAL